jgi:hypothetical protein
MFRGPALSRLLPALALVVTCLGCHSLREQRTAPPTPPGLLDLTPARHAADGPPAPPLQIAGSPAPPMAPPSARPLESPPSLASTPPAAPTPAPPPVQVASLATPGTQPAGAPSLEPTRLTAPPPAAEPASPLRRLARDATAVYASFDAYSGRLRQREQVNGKDRPEELMLVKFRKQPWSVYFKWVGTQAQGREVVYVEGRYDGKIHTRLAAGDVLLMPAGARFDVAPDSVLARGRSRHPITEASIGTQVERFGRLVDAAEKGGQGAAGLTYLGTQTRPEFGPPVEVVEQMIPPGAEPGLPRGGHRQWFFAPDSRLPVLIIARDEKGHEVEYYCYDQLQYPARFTDDDFNPDSLWAKK